MMLSKLMLLAAPGAMPALLALAAISAHSQQTTGAPSLPDAARTIDGRYLPDPPPPLGGEINPNASIETILAGTGGAAQQRPTCC
jgi:hypothetical protein